MKYYLIIAFLSLPSLSPAQSRLAGLGNFTIGRTTPDSLNRIDFTEEDQPYVKGTLTLPCTHIRLFTAREATIAGTHVTDLVLYFHDNMLFKMSCKYRDELSGFLRGQYGPSTPKAPVSLQFCPQAMSKPLLMWGEAWSTGDMLALVVHAKGHAADCKPVEVDKLTIVSQQVLALSSECDLQQTDSFTDAFIKAQKD
jgi:hypothetical protein